MPAHPLHHLRHLLRVETGEQHALQRVAVHAPGQDHLMGLCARHAHQPLRIGELHAKLGRSRHLLELQVQPRAMCATSTEVSGNLYPTALTRIAYLPGSIRSSGNR